MEYRIVTGTDSHSDEDPAHMHEAGIAYKVIKFMEEGWKLYGSPFMQRRTSTDGTIVIQAMIKD